MRIFVIYIHWQSLRRYYFLFTLSETAKDLGKTITPLDIASFQLESRFSSVGSPCAVVAKVLDWNIVVNEFELQLHYYIHFGLIHLGKV